jgi:hypothetical protein
MLGAGRELAPETDCDSRTPLVASPLRVVCPGIYAGRIGDRVKIGCSLNLPQRVDAFRFEELIAVLPVHVPRDPADDDRGYSYRVRDAVRDLEARLHAALAGQRVPGVSRANANEWFRFDDRVLMVLFEAGAILARPRVSGRPLGTRAGKPGWPLRLMPSTATIQGAIARLMELAGGAVNVRNA